MKRSPSFIFGCFDTDFRCCQIFLDVSVKSSLLSMSVESLNSGFNSRLISWVNSNVDVEAVNGFRNIFFRVSSSSLSCKLYSESFTRQFLGSVLILWRIRFVIFVSLNSIIFFIWDYCDELFCNVLKLFFVYSFPKSRFGPKLKFLIYCYPNNFWIADMKFFNSGGTIFEIL